MHKQVLIFVYVLDPYAILNVIISDKKILQQLSFLPDVGLSNPDCLFLLQNPKISGGGRGLMFPLRTPLQVAKNIS